MALTVDKIHAAADHIAAQGERPTLARVRKMLGGGSFSTISEAMQSWRAEQAQEHALAEVEVPEAISERVEQLKSAAWESAMTEAEKRLSAERAALEEVQADAAGEVAEAREAVDMLEAEAEQRDGELETLREQLSDAESLAKEAIAARQRAEQQRDADASRLGERIEGLEARLGDAQESRENAEAREAAIGKTLERVRYQLGEAEQCNADAAQLKERVEGLEARLADAQESRKNAETALQKQEQARQAAEASLVSDRKHHENELEEWRRMHDTTQESVSEAVEKVTRLEERNSGLETRLTECQKLVEWLTVLDEGGVEGDPNAGSEEDQQKLW
ncbi:DNA-binding protein [Vreelandella jeotgali]|uniref:DNA-binding protein n=1 Tax=Vreelandella jeotgali TaxID=553386 RepID=UPI000349101A|nr:DNA-binding protein [Halomonas jeotgali]